MVMNEFGETGEGHGVDVLDVVVEDILTPVEEGAYDVMAVTEYVDYETEPDRYIRGPGGGDAAFDGRSGRSSRNTTPSTSETLGRR